MNIAVAVVVILLAGCASPSRTARDYAMNKMDSAAYGQLTLELHGSRKGDTDYSHALVAEFPGVREYGNSLFTDAYLADYVEKQSSMEWIQRRLTTYCATNTPEDCAATIQRVKDAEKNRKPPNPAI